MHPELLRKQGNGSGFTRQTRQAGLSWFCQSRLSSASRNCMGVHGPSDARQFHMNNCCLTAGFRALSPSTLSFADSLGWQKRLQTLPASVQHLSSGYTRKEHTAGLYTLAEGLYLMGDIAMLQPQVFSSGSPVLVAVRVSRRSCSTAYLLQQSTVIDLFPGLRDWPCARPHGDRARKEQHRCIASLLNTEKHDMHRVRLARVISTMEWPTKDLQVVLKLRNSQAV